MKKIMIFLIIMSSLFFTGCFKIDGYIVTEDMNLDKLHKGEISSAFTTINVTSGNKYYIKGFSTNDVHLLERSIYAITTGANLSYTINLYEGGVEDSSNTTLTKYSIHRGFEDNTNFEINMTNVNVNISEAILLPFGNKELSDKKYSSTRISTTEYILKANTTYYLEIINNDGGVLTLDIRWLFYEEN